MSIAFACPKCRGNLAVADAAEDDTIVCPYCRAEVAVPQPDVPSPAPRKPVTAGPPSAPERDDRAWPGPVRPPERYSWRQFKEGLALELGASQMLFVAAVLFIPLAFEVVPGELGSTAFVLLLALVTLVALLLMCVARGVCAAAPSLPTRAAAAGSAYALAGTPIALTALIFFSAARQVPVAPGCFLLGLIAGAVVSELLFVLQLRGAALECGDLRLAQGTLLYGAGAIGGMGAGFGLAFAASYVPADLLPPHLPLAGWCALAALVLAWRCRTIRQVQERLGQPFGPAEPEEESGGGEISR